MLRTVGGAEPIDDGAAKPDAIDSLVDNFVEAVKPSEIAEVVVISDGKKASCADKETIDDILARMGNNIDQAKLSVIGYRIEYGHGHGFNDRGFRVIPK
jgi:hypothetical protein